MEAIYQATTQKSFEEAVVAVQVQTQMNGFRVLHIHDVQATLAEKDFQREPLKVVEVCNAKFAHTALSIDVTVGLLMPCRINVYREEGNTVISTVRPTALVTMFQNDQLRDFASEVEEVLVKIIDQSVK